MLLRRVFGHSGISVIELLLERWQAYIWSRFIQKHESYEHITSANTIGIYLLELDDLAKYM
jgi:hypothetical protein